MDGFEWNPAKAAANLAKHKVESQMPPCRWKIRAR
jgi:hypothetical protein